ncbi:GNAT family N-acetyltransferase [Sutcliffiella halmapala]|uniref:GNAT family N-acetyltransferase n=1 Tax=Sutcliffiella halmapala TaxID=79882 RepID=UPI000994D284|nr:GNAT family N-acetyltransferase [Sutcliffiella halmapala]
MSTVIVREATKDDAAKIIEHCKIAFSESRNLLTAPEEYTITVEEEIAWIEDNKEKNNLVLVAEQDHHIVGMLNARRGSRKRVEHICHFGISIQEAYCNNGLGKRMIQILLDWATQDPQIEKVSLEVFSHNDRGIHLYKKLGFNMEGKKEKHAKFEDGTYADEYVMGQFVK